MQTLMRQVDRSMDWLVRMRKQMPELTKNFDVSSQIRNKKDITPPPHLHSCTTYRVYGILLQGPSVREETRARTVLWRNSLQHNFAWRFFAVYIPNMCMAGSKALDLINHNIYNYCSYIAILCLFVFYNYGHIRMAANYWPCTLMATL